MLPIITDTVGVRSVPAYFMNLLVGLYLVFMCQGKGGRGGGDEGWERREDEIGRCMYVRVPNVAWIAREKISPVHTRVI